MPELPRIRRILEQERLFVVVQDLFLTETARLADVVLPGATWGEKLGTFTSVDRTVHLSEKAVEPPGEARADLDIFLDYARRMDLRDRDGAPLITWHDAESAFEAWKACSAGRPCDYTGMTYEKLRGGGVQWPCTAERPDGTERLYTDGVFNTDPDYCETYGEDLGTGAARYQAGGDGILQEFGSFRALWFDRMRLGDDAPAGGATDQARLSRARNGRRRAYRYRRDGLPRCGRRAPGDWSG